MKHQPVLGWRWALNRARLTKKPVKSKNIKITNPQSNRGSQAKDENLIG